jgi:carbamate kinase
VLATGRRRRVHGLGHAGPARGRRATPAWLRTQAFAGGPMGPKAEAVCRFVETTGGRAAIGQLEAIPGLIAGTAETQIDGRRPAVEYWE